MGVSHRIQGWHQLPAPPLWFLEAIWLRSAVLSACSPTPPPSPRPGPDLTTSLTSCTPRGPSSTGTLGRVWRRESSLRLERILLLLRRIMRRSVSTLLMLRMAKEMNIKTTFLLDSEKNG